MAAHFFLSFFFFSPPPADGMIWLERSRYSTALVKNYEVVEESCRGDIILAIRRGTEGPSESRNPVVIGQMWAVGFIGELLATGSLSASPPPKKKRLSIYRFNG